MTAPTGGAAGAAGAARNHALGGLEATIAIARASWTRVVRTRGLYGAAAVMLLPTLMAYFFHAMHTRHWRGVFDLGQVASGVLAALLVAGPIGEEFEDRTMTYLWSRPLPRWTVITGKLAALAPLAMGLAGVGTYLALDLAGGEPASAVTDAAIGATAAVGARAALAAAWATLVPRQALALTVTYLFIFDLPLIAIPAKLQLLSIAFHEQCLAGVSSEESKLAAAIGLAAVAAGWLAVALWRVRRIE